MRKLLLSRSCRALACCCAIVTLGLPLTAKSWSDPEEKMKANEVVAKHLESIGTAAARANAKGRVATGTSRASYRARNTAGSIDGRAAFATEDRKAMFALIFDSPSYTGERFGYDGKKLTVGYVTPGNRSALGSFVLQYGEMFREGLLGGTLSTTWPLLNLAERGAKLDYSGTVKIDNRPVHKLSYAPKKGSDLRITLYFDGETFQHVRTEYSRLISGRLGSGGIDAQTRQTETRVKIIENFSGYKKEGELTLPHSYTLILEITKPNGSSTDKWETELTQFLFDQHVDDKLFNVEAS